MIELEEYLLILKQEGQGCDYTIGCGMRYKKILIPANNKAAREKALKEATVEYYGGDNILEEAFLIPMHLVTELPISNWYHEVHMERLEREKASQQEKELKQLEFLKKKYEQ